MTYHIFSTDPVPALRRPGGGVGHFELKYGSLSVAEQNLQGCLRLKPFVSIRPHIQGLSGRRIVAQVSQQDHRTTHLLGTAHPHLLNDGKQIASLLTPPRPRFTISSQVLAITKAVWRPETRVGWHMHASRLFQVANIPFDSDRFRYRHLRARLQQDDLETDGASPIP